MQWEKQWSVYLYVFICGIFILFYGIYKLVSYQPKLSEYNLSKNKQNQ